MCDDAALWANIQNIMTCTLFLQGNNADFEYIDMWSSVFTWGGNPLPVAGDLVVIPEDMTVRLDVDTPVFKVLLINGQFYSELIRVFQRHSC